jgi:hypothetical protein
VAKDLGGGHLYGPSAPWHASHPWDPLGPTHGW